MTKADLKTGMRVTHRNGNMSIVVLNASCDSESKGIDKVIQVKGKWVDGLNYYDDKSLDNEIYKDLDIVKVEIPLRYVDYFKENGEYKTIWERKEPKPMTLAEIEKELGYPVKIIK